MSLEFEKQIKYARGKIIFLKFGRKNINLIQIKKGFVRCGHFHQTDTSHFLISGKIEYPEKMLKQELKKFQQFLHLT